MSSARFVWVIGGLHIEKKNRSQVHRGSSASENWIRRVENLQTHSRSSVNLQKVSGHSDSRTSVEELQWRWSDAAQRRCILAYLVRGVYDLEWGRMHGISVESNLSAHASCQSVGFLLLDMGEYNGSPSFQDESISLAVYRWNDASPLPPPSSKIVVAIRGTIGTMNKVLDDGWHNMHIPLQSLHLTTRYKQILNSVRNVVQTHGPDAVCVAGHSLGAALGLLVARTLAGEGLRLDSHFFNPPYPSTWLPGVAQTLENEGLGRAIWAAHCATTLSLSYIFRDHESRTAIADEYALLEQWAPNLYINKGDPICRGYWDYFHNHDRLASRNPLAAYISSLAAPFSGRGLFLIWSKPMHLVPSAMLHVCEESAENSLGFVEFPSIYKHLDYRNHELKLWWLQGARVERHEIRLATPYSSSI